jgi:hypothetical protein
MDGYDNEKERNVFEYLTSCWLWLKKQVKCLLGNLDDDHHEE